jgi:hypothetical protein
MILNERASVKLSQPNNNFFSIEIYRILIIAFLHLYKEDILINYCSELFKEAHHSLFKFKYEDSQIEMILNERA